MWSNSWKSTYFQHHSQRGCPYWYPAPLKKSMAGISNKCFCEIFWINYYTVLSTGQHVRPARGICYIQHSTVIVGVVGRTLVWTVRGLPSICLLIFTSNVKLLIFDACCANVLHAIICTHLYLLAVWRLPCLYPDLEAVVFPTSSANLEISHFCLDMIIHTALNPWEKFCYQLALHMDLL